MVGTRLSKACAIRNWRSRSAAIRKRLSVDNVMHMMGHEMTIKAQPHAALPVVTFTDDVTLHLNGDDVHVIHVPPARTDGDSIVHFKTPT
jgi:cyclase